MRIINAMDYVISLAGDTSEGFEAVKAFSNPQNLQKLIEVSVLASVRNQVMVQKMLQQLLMLDLGQIIFDQAVKLAAEKNEGENKIAEILNQDSCLKFEGSVFLQFLFNRMQVTRKTLYAEKKAKSGLNSVMREQMRTVRLLFTHLDRNESLRKTVLNTLELALTTEDLSEMNPADIDALMSLVPEAAFKSLSIGAPCIGKDGKTVCSLGAIESAEGQMHTQKVVSNLSEKNFYLSTLYFDPQHPSRQDIVTIPLNQAFHLLDIEEDFTAEAATKSIFMDVQTLEPLMEVL